MVGAVAAAVLANVLVETGRRRGGNLYGNTPIRMIEPAMTRLWRFKWRVGDSNGKGYIDFNDFIMLVMKFRTAAIESNVQECFNRLDANNDGKIDRKEIEDMLNKKHNLDKKETDDLFESIDLNNDGLITYEEFECYWNKKISKQTVRFKYLASAGSQFRSGD